LPLVVVRHRIHRSPLARLAIAQRGPNPPPRPLPPPFRNRHFLQAMLIRSTALERWVGSVLCTRRRLNCNRSARRFLSCSATTPARQLPMLMCQPLPKTREERLLHRAQAKERTPRRSGLGSGPSLISTSSPVLHSPVATRCRSRPKACPPLRTHSIQQRYKSLRQTSRALQLPVVCRTRRDTLYKDQSQYTHIASIRQVILRAISTDLPQARLATSHQMLQTVFSLTRTIKGVRRSWWEHQATTSRRKRTAAIPDSGCSSPGSGDDGAPLLSGRDVTTDVGTAAQPHKDRWRRRRGPSARRRCKDGLPLTSR
jgi:hypothetical protein